MKRILAAFVGATLATLTAHSAQAHFQLIYTPEVNLEKAGDVPFKLIFWHPFENGHVMDMGQPEEFFYVHNGKKKDLMKTEFALQALARQFNQDIASYNQSCATK